MISYQVVVVLWVAVVTVVEFVSGFRVVGTFRFSVGDDDIDDRMVWAWDGVICRIAAGVYP